MDIGLPGMDGYELARAVRATPQLRPVVLVAVTGYGDAAARQQSLAAGFDYHMTKPVDLSALERLLASAAGWPDDYTCLK
ncbi:Cyclic di-GMP phosphodiesterase response regulator RpfG (plasmid) [Burkholderia sp. AD24]|nr:Cyclic di-GMP phosphodiesterase response regulator RpfG [Burkholderia sp. AD24]